MELTSTCVVLVKHKASETILELSSVRQLTAERVWLSSTEYYLDLHTVALTHRGKRRGGHCLPHNTVVQQITLLVTLNHPKKKRKPHSTVSVNDSVLFPPLSCLVFLVSLIPLLIMNHDFFSYGSQSFVYKERERERERRRENDLAEP